MDAASKRVHIEKAQNFMRQYRDPESRELKKLSANQFMDVWSHYDRDGNSIYIIFPRIRAFRYVFRSLYRTHSDEFRSLYRTHSDEWIEILCTCGKSDYFKWAALTKLMMPGVL